MLENMLELFLIFFHCNGFSKSLEFQICHRHRKCNYYSLQKYHYHYNIPSHAKCSSAAFNIFLGHTWQCQSRCLKSGSDSAKFLLHKNALVHLNLRDCMIHQILHNARSHPFYHVFVDVGRHNCNGHHIPSCCQNVSNLRVL